MTTGVLAMSYGTPVDHNDIKRFYTDIRGGRPPSDEQLHALVARYDAIGGVSPLNERTTSQVHALGVALEALAPGRYLAAFGSKHAPPRIEEAIDELASHAIDKLIGIVLAPHFSTLSVGEYLARAHSHAQSIGLEARFVERWGEEPVLLELLAERVQAGLQALNAKGVQKSAVIFTAHSLPARILTSGDPYVDELGITAKAVAALASLSHYEFAWQSAAKTPEPWLSPDLLSVLERLGGDGVDGVVVCPVGFTSDHLEILYDLDIEAAAEASLRGITFVRTPSLNDDPRLFSALAARVNELSERHNDNTVSGHPH